MFAFYYRTIPPGFILCAKWTTLLIESIEFDFEKSVKKQNRIVEI